MGGDVATWRRGTSRLKRGGGWVVMWQCGVATWYVAFEARGGWVMVWQCGVVMWRRGDVVRPFEARGGWVVNVVTQDLEHPLRLRLKQGRRVVVVNKTTI